MPIVTIITLTYNHEKFIEKCILSVLSQTYEDWEHIIIDDGSTDSTIQIALKYSKMDKRIKVIQHPHVGIYRMSELYNLALSESTGELICVLDGDDYYEKNKLKLQVPWFKEINCVLVWGQVIEVDVKENILAINPNEAKGFSKMNNNELIKTLFFGCYIPALSVMVRKNSLELVGGFKQPHNLHCVDYPTWLSLIPLGKFVFINKPLGYWVKHKTNISKRFQYDIKWCYCSIDAFRSLPRKIKNEIRLSEKELINKLQFIADRNVINKIPPSIYNVINITEIKKELEMTTLNSERIILKKKRILNIQIMLIKKIIKNFTLWINYKIFSRLRK